jgi:hypothetical protein
MIPENIDKINFEGQSYKVCGLETVSRCYAEGGITA